MRTLTCARCWVTLGVLAVAVFAAGPASAANYQGDTANWNKLTLAASAGQVTSFATRSGTLQTCSGVAIQDSNDAPIDVTYAGPPVAVTDGVFELSGTIVEDAFDSFAWSTKGTVSPDGREITGTLTATGDRRIVKACTGTWTFDAVIAPGHSVSTSTHGFQQASTTSGASDRVTFDYAKGVITHLYARVGVTCPDSSVLGADFNSTAYGLDPIRVHKDGSFSITSAVIDSYGVINHFTVKGRIRGHTASGSLRSTREEDTGNIDGVGVVACTHAGTWKAEGPAPVVPVKIPAKPSTGAGDPPSSSGPIASGPTAYFDVDGYRRGSQGAWTYYLIVTISGCADATSARVEVVGGAVKTATCSGKVQLGPLTPKHYYQVRVTAVGSRAVTQPLAPIYLPGDDGNWVRITGAGYVGEE